MKINVSSLAFGATLKTATQVVNRAGSILLIPVFTRVMTPSDYGIVNLIGTFSSIIALLSLGFPVAQQVNYHRLKDTPDKLGSYLFTINTTSAGALLLATIVLLFTPWSEALVRLLLGTDEIRLFPHVAIGIGLGICAAFNNLSTGFLNIRKQFHIQSVLSVFGFLLTAGLSWVLLVNFHLGAEGRLIGMLAGGVIPLGVSMLIYLKASNSIYSVEYLKDAWKIGWPAAVNWGIFLVINQSDRIVLSHFLDLETVGLYTLAFTLASGIAVVVQSVAQSYSPFFMETATAKNGDVSSLKAMTYRSVSAVLLIALVASAWLPDLVRVLLPKNYAMTVTFLPCMVGALGLYIIFSILSLNYNFHKKTLYMPAYTVFSAALSAGLNLILVPRYGAGVSAINSLATYAILSLVCLWVTYKIFPSIQMSPKIMSAVVIAYSGLVLLAHWGVKDFVTHVIVGGLLTSISLAVGYFVFVKARRAKMEGVK